MWRNHGFRKHASNLFYFRKPLVRKQNMIIVAARPSKGKTTFAINLALNVARQKKTVLFFTLEMSKEELVFRMLSILNGITVKEIQKLQYKTDIFNQKLCELADLNLFIDDNSRLSLFDLKTKCRKVKRKSGLDLVIVDYIGLMQEKSQDRVQEVSKIARGIKQIAKDLDVPIIALAQLNRNIENRIDTRPKPSDLKESGEIEQTADILLFLHEPEGMDNISDGSLKDVIVSKNRNGEIGFVQFIFNKKHGKFEEYELQPMVS